MAILIDPPAWPAHGTLWSHLVSDTGYEELHLFAARLGVPRRGFDLDHYDVPASLYAQAVSSGAEPVGAKELVYRLRDAGLRVRQVEREAVAPLRRRQYLYDEWKLLGQTLSIELASNTSTVWEDTGQDLLSRWNEPHRTYHDERHLEDVLLSLNQLSVRGEQIAPDTQLAAWFHDAVYEGSLGDDERNSAELAAEKLTDFGFPSDLIDTVFEMILATTPGEAPEEPGQQLAHLLDADLSILGAAPHRYANYASNVRHEYAHVTDEEFAAGRAEILAGFLEQPMIYRTVAARQLWEERARQNLAHEVELLLGRKTDAAG